MITVEDVPCESHFSIDYFKKTSSSIFFSFPTDFFKEQNTGL